MFCDFLYTFTDKQNRAIAIVKENYSYDLVAYHGELTEVGRFQFAPGDPDDGYYLDFELVDMNVEQGFQRAGIGSELMKASVNYYHDFKLPAMHFGSSKYQPDNYLLPDGINLVNHCFNTEILPERFRRYMPETGDI